MSSAVRTGEQRFTVMKGQADQLITTVDDLLIAKPLAIGKADHPVRVFQSSAGHVPTSRESQRVADQGSEAKGP